MSKLGKLADIASWKIQATTPLGPVVDQNWVVWWRHSMMSRDAYESARCGNPPYNELPYWDSHAQNIVEVGE